MRSSARYLLATSVAAFLIATLALVAGTSRRNAWLKETGETRRAVEESAARLLPATAESAADPQLRAAAAQLAQQPYVTRLWLVDPSGRILLSRNSPGREGESVGDLASDDFAAVLRGAPDAALTGSQRTQLLAMAAQRRDGDHNDVFKPLLRVVRTPSGTDAAFVALCYLVNTAASGVIPLVLAAAAGLVIYWIGLVGWVFIDARARQENAALWAMLVFFTNLVGALAYVLATRPPKKHVVLALIAVLLCAPPVYCQTQAERWNQILTADKPGFNTNPNAFLVEMVKDRKPGTALDVGMGQGRNAIWLAQQGWSVTGFDPADRAVELARQTAQRRGLRLNTEIATEESFDFGENRWDVILLSYVGVHGVTEKVQRALKPGGLVVVEAFHRDAAQGRPVGGGVVFDTGELVKLFPTLRVVRYEEPIATADFGLQRVRVVRYCAERPE